MSLPRFDGMSVRDLKRLLVLYERGRADLAEEKMDEVILARHDIRKQFAFSQATLAALDQQIAGMRVALGLEAEPIPPRIYA